MAEIIEKHLSLSVNEDKALCNSLVNSVRTTMSEYCDYVFNARPDDFDPSKATFIMSMAVRYLYLLKDLGYCEEFTELHKVVFKVY